MKIICIFILIFQFCCLFLSCEKKKEESYYKDEANFICGTILLSTSSSDIKKKAANFKKLKEVTGLSTDSIIIFLEKNIRNNPENGKKLYESINKIITDTCSFNN